MKKYNLWLKIQLILAILILAVDLIYFQVGRIPNPLIAFGLVIAVITLILNSLKIKQNWELVLKDYLNSFIPVSLVLALRVVLIILLKNVASYHLLIVIIYSILALSLWIPYVQVILIPLKRFVPRLLSVYLLFESTINLLVVGYRFNNSIIQAINYSSVVNALLFFIVICFVSKKWWPQRTLNLHFMGSIKSQWWFLLLLCLLTIWCVIFDVLVRRVQALKDAVWDWQVIFTQLINFPSLTAVLVAVYAGIIEETERWLNLNIVLREFKQKKWKIEIAVLISAFIFGMYHFLNYFTGQSMPKTIAQMLNTFAMGCFLAALYLFTGKLWIIMVIHASTDFFIFWLEANPLTDIHQSEWWIVYDPRGIFPLVLVMLVYIILTIILLTGKRRQIVQENIKQIIGS